MVRVAERPRERRPGFTASPRWVPGEGLTIDWLPNDAIEVLDPRVVKRKADGLVRLTFISHLRVVRCGDGRSVEEVTGCSVPARLGDGGVRRRGSADHGAGWSLLLHLCRRLAAWRSDRPGLDDRFPHVRAAWDHLLPREQGRGAVPGAGRRGIRGTPPPERGDAVLPAGDVGRPFARPGPLGPSRLPARRRCRVGDRPRRRRHAAGAGRGWLAGDLPRQSPADPARRGRTVLDRALAPGSRQPGPDPPPHCPFGIRADGRFRTQGLRAGCRVSDRDRRDGGLVPGLLRGGRFLHGGGGILERRSPERR